MQQEAQYFLKVLQLQNSQKWNKLQELYNYQLPTDQQSPRKKNSAHIVNGSFTLQKNALDFIQSYFNNTMKEKELVA